MRILFTKTFTKQYWKLRELHRKRVDGAIELFRQNPLASLLRNHPLKGSAKGARAISAGFDLRIIFEERDGYAIVLMIAVGRHEEVY